MSPTADRVAVSVIVPVHNPGSFIEVCIDSLLSQSLTPQRYELIFVDDGSMDETPARLDELAAAHANVLVFHEPASGWSGRPRNVGLDQAAGEYVFFCDHDDWLAPEALERMVAYADDAAADVLVPKMVGHNREVPKALFLANDPDAMLSSSLLMSSLTPHKLFRREFLAEHGLRFPEGPRRLEDHVFVVAAYFLAERIAVLSDYPCYHHIRRDDGANAAYDLSDPVDYLRYLREVIDVIEAHTEPGPLRDLVLERPFGSELLGRVTRPRLFDAQPPDRQQRAFDAVRAMMVDRFPAEFAARLPLVPRVRADAVRDGSIDTVRELNRRASAVRGSAVLTSMTWSHDHWRADIEAGARYDDGSPVRLIPVGDDRWGVDERLMPPGLAARYPLTTEELADVVMLVTVTDRGNDEDWFAPSQFVADLRPIHGDPDAAHRLVFTGSADLDVSTLAGGRALDDGIWDISLRYAFLGVTVRPRVGVDVSTDLRMPTAAIIGPRPATARPFLTKGGDKLSIDIGQRKSTLLDAILAGPIGPAVITDSEIRIPINVDIAPGSAPRTLRLCLLDDGGGIAGRCLAQLVTGPGGTELQTGTQPTAAGAIAAPATYRLATKTRAKDDLRVVGSVTLDATGRITAIDLTG